MVSALVVLAVFDFGAVMCDLVLVLFVSAWRVCD